MSLSSSCQQYTSEEIDTYLIEVANQRCGATWGLVRVEIIRPDGSLAECIDVDRGCPAPTPSLSTV
jgi:hypothetical protein